MKYAELTEAEKKELRETLWSESCYHDGYTDFDYLPVGFQEVVSRCWSADDIPEKIVAWAYDIYDFVPGDFFCNTEDQFCDRLGNEIA